MAKTRLYSRVILLLLVIALIITVVNTAVSVERLNKLSYTFNLITAAASSTGTGDTNLTITATTSLTNQQQTIDFGSGRVNSSCDFCEMDSNSTTVSLYSNGSNASQIIPTLANCCVSFFVVQNGFLLENTGNVNISVGYTCAGNCTSASFIGGTRSPGMGGLQIRVAPNNIAKQTNESGVTDTTNSCTGGGLKFRDTQWNITNSTSYSGGGVQGGSGNSVYTSLSSSGHWLCGNYTNAMLEPNNDRDAGVVDINITIPQDAPAGAGRSSFRLTFNGTDASG